MDNIIDATKQLLACELKAALDEIVGAGLVEAEKVAVEEVKEVDD